MRANKTSTNRAVLYTRDSEGRHDQTAPQYVKWAQEKAEKLGVTFRGRPEQILRMIKEEIAVEGDIYLDYGVQGNHLSRPALDRLKEDLCKDKSITHVLIPRRDRLARPDQAVNGILLESEICSAGATIVFEDKVIGPLKRGSRQELNDILAGLMEYHASGMYREELAQKMLRAQLELAQNGFSTGGRAPYGFRRYLVRGDDTVLRELNDGEVVRQRGHHVVWLPGPDEEMKVVFLILAMLKTMAARKVAQKLTEFGIPSPNAGRTRKDNGVRHVVRNEWQSNTVTNIAKNPLLRGIVSYGRRSMGDQRRFSPNGPRRMEEDDYRQDGQPKVISNPETIRINAKSHFEPVVPPEQINELIAILDQRGKTQKGKPRSRNPEKNPLGGRVTDMACGWPMYRIPAGESFRYRCGLYGQSNGQGCKHNQIDGQIVTHFALAAIRQVCLHPSFFKRLEEKLRTKCAKSKNDFPHEKSTLAANRAELNELQSQKKLAMKNWTLAPTDELREAALEVIADLDQQIKALQGRPDQEKKEIRPLDCDELVQSALAEISRLPQLAGNTSNLGSIGELFSRMNLQVFLRFEQVQAGKRTLNRLASGILTFGNAPAPVQKYEGPTGRRGVTATYADTRKALASKDLSEPYTIDSDLKAKSLRNVNRGDTI